MGEAFWRAWEDLFGRIGWTDEFPADHPARCCSILAIRAGWADERRSVDLLLDSCTRSGANAGYPQEPVEIAGKVFLVALVLDAIYQIIVFHWFYRSTGCRKSQCEHCSPEAVRGEKEHAAHRELDATP
jgi:hypothetical protein